MRNRVFVIRFMESSVKATLDSFYKNTILDLFLTLLFFFICLLFSFYRNKFCTSFQRRPIRSIFLFITFKLRGAAQLYRAAFLGAQC